MSMKRRRSNARWTIALCLLLVAWLSVRPAGAAPDAPPALALDGPERALATAATIDVTVTVSDAVELAAFEADLGYDPALVDVVGITAGGFLGDPDPACDPDVARCEATLGPLPQDTGVTAVGGYAFGAGTPPDGSGTLAVVHLAPTGATGTLTLTLGNALAADVAASPITPTVQGTVIRLVSPGREIYLPVVLRESE